MKLRNQLILISTTLTSDFPNDRVSKLALLLSKKNIVYILHSTEPITIYQCLFNAKKRRYIINILAKMIKYRNIPINHILPIGFLFPQRVPWIYKINYSFIRWFYQFLLIRRGQEQRPILWIFSEAIHSPFGFNYAIGEFKEKLCIYDCSSLDTFKKEGKKVSALEADTMEKADLILTDSPKLFKESKLHCPQTHKVSRTPKSKQGEVGKILEQIF